MRVDGLWRLIYLVIPVLVLITATPAMAQDDILDEIEAELRKEEEQKKAQAKADKNKEKYKANYQAAVRKGDALMRSKKYDDAIAAYTEAKKWGPMEAYPDQQLSKAREEKKAAEEAAKQAEIDTEYKAIISKADAYFNGKKYQEAISQYQAAAKVKPDQAYPKDQIGEAKTLQAKLEEEKKAAAAQEALNKKYDAAMSAGDAALKSKDFTTAIAKYTEAEKLKPTEAEAKSRKETAEKMKTDEEARLANEKLQNEYNALITEADNLLKSSNFDQAKLKYEAASKVLPHETYPKNKMKECDDSKLAAEQAALRAQYDALVKEGDVLLKAEDFDAAVAKYEEANKVLPHETHPKDMIKQAESLKANKAKQEVQTRFDAALLEAEKLIADEKFDEGIAKLKEASKILPGESRTTELIAEAEKLKADKATQLTKSEYEAKLKEGEELMHANEYDAAIGKFEEAKLILATDHRADNLIQQVKGLKEDKAKQETLSQFNDKISEGEKLLEEERFDEAIIRFEEAQKILPNDPKPKSLISQTNTLRSAKEEQMAKQEYDEHLAAGDKALEAKNFEEARTSYKSALAAYAAGQNTVNARLAKVDGVEQETRDAEKAAADAKAKEDQFNKLVAESDAALEANDLEGAKTKIEQALNLYPNDADAKSKKSSIEGAILVAEQERQKKLAEEAAAKEQADKEAKATDFVNKADEALKAGEYNQANNYISSALTVIPEFPAAVEKQAEIKKAKDEYDLKLAEDQAAQEAALKAEQEKKAKIDALLGEANGFMSSGEYESAITKYDEVLAIDPSNGMATTDKERAQKAIEQKKQDELAALAAADKLAAEKAKKEQVNGLLSSGDQLMASGDYNGAKAKYQEVLSLDSGNTTATSKIAQADAAIENEKQEALAKQQAEQDKLAAEEQAQLEADKQAKIASLSSEAQSLESSEDIDGAIAKWNEVNALDAANADASQNINRLNSKKSEMAAALALQQEAERKRQAEADAQQAEEAKLQAEAEKQAKIQGLADQAKSDENSGNLDGALQKWQEVLSIEATNSDATTSIARIEGKKEQIAKAEEEARLEEERQKSEADAKAAALRKKEADAQKQAKIQSLADEAKGAESTGNLDLALSKWNEVLSLDASSAVAIAAVSRLEDRKAKLKSEEEAAALAAQKAAEEEATKKSAIERKNLIASYLETGDQILADKQYDKAIETYKKAENLAPDNTEIKSRINRAETLKNEENQRIARLEAAERQQEISLLLSEAKLLGIKRKYKESGEKYNQVLEMDPGNTRAKEELASIQGYIDQIAKEEAILEQRRKEAEERRKQVEVILDAGADLYAGGQYDKAIAKYKEGLSIDPLNAELKASIRNANQSKERAEQYRIAKLHHKPRPKPEGFKTESLDQKKDRKDKTAFQNELGKKYPEGVTEEKTEATRKSITRRVVVKEGNGSEYFKVRHDWGGVYYFKNGESITPYLWQYGTRSPDQITN